MTMSFRMLALVSIVGSFAFAFAFAFAAEAQSFVIVSPDGKRETEVPVEAPSTQNSLSTDKSISSRSLSTEAVPGGSLHVKADPGGSLNAEASNGQAIRATVDQNVSSPALTTVEPSTATHQADLPAPSDKMKEALNAGQTIRFEGVLFDHDKADLKRDSMPIVLALAAALLESPEIRVNINGYTDSHGGLDYNIDLSRRRAQAVEEALVKQGVRNERLHVNAYGVASPIADNSTEDGRARNRRVEVVPASD